MKEIIDQSNNINLLLDFIFEEINYAKSFNLNFVKIDYKKTDSFIYIKGIPVMGYGEFKGETRTLIATEMYEKVLEKILKLGYGCTAYRDFIFIKW